MTEPVQPVEASEPTPTTQVPLSPVAPAQEPTELPIVPADEVKPEPEPDQEAEAESPEADSTPPRPDAADLLFTGVTLVASILDPSVWVPVDPHTGVNSWQAGSLDKVQAWAEEFYASEFPGKLYWTQVDDEEWDLEYEQSPAPEPEPLKAPEPSPLINTPVILQLHSTEGTVQLVGPPIPPAAQEVLVKAGIYYSELTDFSDPDFSNGSVVHPAAIKSPPPWYPITDSVDPVSEAKPQAKKPWWKV